MQLNLLPTIQQAISQLLTVHEPEFLRFGYSLFLSFATIEGNGPRTTKGLLL